MPVSEKYKAPFHAENYYHLTFRSIDNLLLFYQPGNYEFILQRFAFFLHPVLDCLAFCLLQNHAHFVVQISERKAILDSLSFIAEEKRTIAMKKFISDPENEDLVDELIERQANSFMISYVNSVNSSLSRKGSLFQSPFRRIQIAGEAHLQQAIIYVHANAQKHGIVRDFKEYRYTSYHDVMSDNNSMIAVSKVLRFFMGKEHFVNEHTTQVQHYYDNQQIKGARFFD
jgi:putative transposase